MSAGVHAFMSADLPAALAAVFVAVTCGLLGNFLVLRRMSLMGDAISHAVLPGLVAGFMIAGSRQSLPMFLGAAAAGVVTVVLVELVRKLGRVESGAAMGVVFSIMFALGIVLIQRAAALPNIDLDPDCVLYGMLEHILWLPTPAPDSVAGYFAWSSLAQLPREVLTLGGMTVGAVVFVALFYKELRISAFDPQLATALGINATLMHFLLMIVVAAAVVASFEAVGSILVIAMLVCPAATARLLTDRLLPQIVVSVGVGAATGVGGYVLGAHAPVWLGAPSAVSAAGTMAVLAGVILGAAVVASPSHGLVARRVRRLRTAVGIAGEDLLAMLYRLEEAAALGAGESVPAELRAGQAVSALGGGVAARLAVGAAVRRGMVTREGPGLRLTEAGRSAARRLVRTHRLWETYLVRELGLRPDHVHRTAMDLEHITTPEIERGLTPGGACPDRDPQGKPIP